MKYLLDTSALLAFIRKENGADQVRKLFETDQTEISVSVLSKAELWSWMRMVGQERSFERVWGLHLELLDRVFDVDPAVVDCSIRLRRACPQHLPTVDALIAGTAAAHNSVLVHRDRHLRVIPSGLLAQLDLEAGVR